MKFQINVNPGARFSYADLEKVLPGAWIVHTIASSTCPCYIEWDDGEPDPLAAIVVPPGHEERLRFLRGAREIVETYEGVLPQSWLDPLATIEHAPSAVETLRLESKINAAHEKIWAQTKNIEARLHAAGVNLGDFTVETLEKMR